MSIKSSSNFAKRMALLSSQIFGDFGKPIDDRSRRIIRILSEKPRGLILKDHYAPLTEYEHIFYKLRYLGLYRNEHADFKDEMKRLRELRGKGKPPRGEKRSK